MKHHLEITALALAIALAATACTSERNASPEAAVPEAAATAAQATAEESSPVSSPSATSAPLRSEASASLVSMRVYKDANCGCCKEWVKHLEQNGFKVEAIDMPDLSAVKTKYGVKPELQACHTAVVGDYTVEGHVPADLILRMLKEKPAIAGLAVPGMPAGSPGMEGATRERYDVLTFDRAGRTTVYARR